jgi:hypothetical protein
MSPAKMGENRHVTPVYFCTFFERELAGLRARSLCERQKLGPNRGGHPTWEVVARKALEQGRGFRKERDREKSDQR